MVKNFKDFFKRDKHIKMKTVLQEIIQWTIENAFNVEAQDGTTYIVIDHEEMRVKFDEWLKKEREQIADAFNDASLDGDKLGHVYYDQTFTQGVYLVADNGSYREQAMGWWENLEGDEVIEVYKKTGNFRLGGWGHDIGPTEEDVEYMYKALFYNVT